MDTVRVISGDKDGADLRREKGKAKKFLRCDGTADDVEINTAIENIGKSKLVSIPGEAWERIFGRSD